MNPTQWLLPFLIFFLTTNALAADLQSWIQQNAVFLSKPNAPLTAVEEAQLDKALQGKRVVFLGEAAHWVHQKYDFRLRYLQYLVGKGFTNIGMEMGLSDGARVDRYFASGDVLDLNRVGMYGAPFAGVSNRSIEGACPLSAKAGREFAELFKGEEVHFYQSLREAGLRSLPVTDSLHHFGFDIDTVPGGAYEDIAAILDEVPHTHSQALRTFLTATPNETLAQEISRAVNILAQVDAQKKDLSQSLGVAKFQSLRLSAKVLVESLRFLAVFNARPCEEQKQGAWNAELMQAMAKREQMMFEIIRYKIDRLGPSAKIVLMGHNFHLSKEPKSLWFHTSDIPEQYAAKMWPSIGEYVLKTLNLDVYSIWMIHHKGTQSNISCPERECPIPLSNTSIGKLFSGAGSVLSLPMHEAPKGFSRLFDFAANGGTYSGNFVQNADLLYFVDEVSGLKPTGN